MTRLIGKLISLIINIITIPIVVVLAIPMGILKARRAQKSRVLFTGDEQVLLGKAQNILKKKTLELIAPFRDIYEVAKCIEDARCDYQITKSRERFDVTFSEFLIHRLNNCHVSDWDLVNSFYGLSNHTRLEEAEAFAEGEPFENVIEAAHLEQKDVLSNNWINNLIKWAKDNNLPERKAVEGMWGGDEYVGFPSDQESISFLSSFNRFARGSIYEANKSLEIDLNNHNISKLPIEFFQLVGIHVLYLHANNLEVLPEEIGNLVNLYSLDLGKNNLKYIPKSICNLRNLEYLNLHGNNLSELPDEIVNLYNLNQINLSGNDNLKLTAEQKNWIQSFDEDDIWIDDDLFDRGSANIQNVKIQESEVTSPFEPKPELQSEQGARNYLSKLSNFDRSTLCVEFSNVRAAKYNLMSMPTGLNNFIEVQTLVTDLTDKSVAICVFVFGQPAVFGYSGGDLRSFNELVNEIDARVVNLNLEPEQHGEQLLKMLGEHLQAGSNNDDIPF